MQAAADPKHSRSQYNGDLTHTLRAETPLLIKLHCLQHSSSTVLQHKDSNSLLCSAGENAPLATLGLALQDGHQSGQCDDNHGDGHWDGGLPELLGYRCT